MCPGGEVGNETGSEVGEARDAARPVRAARARRGMDPAERRRVMDALGLNGGAGWVPPFSVMLGLSVVVAVMGVSADSAAAVIGAMLLAPLMGPVLGVGAALSMGLPHRLARAVTIVTLASAAAVAIAYLLAAGLRDGPLAGEVLSRTSPDLRDLVVALAAGAAGAYATVRTDVSSALPGVAVAVALVPPLAAIGVTLEAGRTDLAGGAVLLYLTNLAAIVAVAIVVFVVTGFVPLRRLQEQRATVLAGGAAAVVALAAVAAPLTVASVHAAADGRKREDLLAATTTWLEGSGNDLDGVRLEDGVVHVRMSGPTPPPPTALLERAVHEIAGPDTGVEIRWAQTQTRSSADPGSTEIADLAGQEAESRDGDVRRIVEDWLAAAGDGFEIESVAVGDDEITVDLRSAEPPPPIEDLTARIEDELDLVVAVVVNWTQRTTLSGADADADEQLRGELDAAIAAWERDQQQVAVTGLAVDGRTVTIDVAGPTPGDVDALRSLVTGIAGDDVTVDIWHTARQLLPTDP